MKRVFNYSLITKKGKVIVSKGKFKSYGWAKKCLKVLYPRCTDIEVTMADRDLGFNGSFNSMV